jgi:hypothetical protein
MHIGKMGLILTAGLAALGLLAAGADEAPKPAEAGTLVIVDAGGKEHKVKDWKFVAGTRRLGWLAAPARAPAKDEAGKGRRARPATPAGPEALVLRAELNVHFAAGVVYLIPLDRLRSLAFDDKERTVSARVAGARPDEDVTLTGTTRYEGINRVTIEAEVSKGEAGIAAITFRGGVPKGGIRAVRFPAAKVAAAAPAGRPAVVHSADKDVKKTYKVSDLQALYAQADGSERLLSTLMFKKTLKVDLNKVSKIVASTEESDDTVWQVVQKDGDDSTLTLLTSMPLDGRPALLVGLLGRVPAGYLLFPVRRIVEVHFDAEGPAAKDKGKDETKDKGKGKEADGKKG